MNSSRFDASPDYCAFFGQLCQSDKLQGHNFCFQHILGDKDSHFSQCSYVYQNGERCTRGAPKLEENDVLCHDHQHQNYGSSQKKVETVGPTTLAEHCMSLLEKYRSKPALSPEHFPEAFSLPTLTKRSIDSIGEDDKDEGATVENAWKYDVDSDAESAESESESPLEHAGTFAIEEVTRIMLDKLIFLQKLYVNQLKRLRHVLTEERRAYRIARCRENAAEILPIGGQPRDSIEDILAYQEAKAMNHYNKPRGLEDALHAELLSKRQKLSENQYVALSQIPALLSSPIATVGSGALSRQKKGCCYKLSTHTRCSEVCIPLTKFCIKHVMNDPKQVLFRSCGVNSVHDGPCEIPIVSLGLSTTCVFHTNFSPPVFSLKKENVDPGALN